MSRSYISKRLRTKVGAQARHRCGYCQTQEAVVGTPLELDQSKSEEGTEPVDTVRVYHDRMGDTVTVWFDDPQKESICEEIDDDDVLIKDKQGRVIGFERLNYLTRSQ
jgi:hypothetical protein